MERRKPLPPTYFWTALLLMIGLHYVFPIKKLIDPPYNYLGAPLLLIGLWINVWASNYFNKIKTAIKPFEESSYLVTEGLFKYSRNPMYVGMVIALLGMVFLSGSISSLFVIPVFIYLMQRKFILVEEKDLEAKFGDGYSKYKSRVRRWI